MGMLAGKNAIITGASRGIGWAIAELFAHEGANIWACASTPNEEFEAHLLSLEETCGVWAKPTYFNLRDESQIKAAVMGITRERLPIDVLVNNAGMPHNGTMAMTPVESLREVLEVNFVAQVYVTQLVSRTMMRHRKGSIINMGSVGGIEGREGYLAYGSSKAALMWATKCMSKELGHFGVRVNALAPGLIDTSMGSFKPQKEARDIVEGLCIKRMGTPQEVAQAALFLASDASSYVTGTVLSVDGGRIV